MPTLFRPNMLLHIEDDDTWQKYVQSILNKSSSIRALHNGDPLKSAVSTISKDVPELELTTEIARLEAEAGGDLSLVSIVTAQVARSFLERNLPAAIISDTIFPLNGRKIVGWLRDHGYPDYPLIGLSATSIEDLSDRSKKFFITGNARYYEKTAVVGKRDIKESFIGQVAYNVGFARSIYGHA